MPYKKESDEPLTKEELTDIIFDTTYTMDLENEENAKSYDCLKLKYIALFEVFSYSFFQFLYLSILPFIPLIYHF